MYEMRYEDLQEIAYAIAVAEDYEYPPSVLAERDAVINNIPYVIYLYMDGPEDPFIEICDVTGVIWSGYDSDLEDRQDLKDRIDPLQEGALWNLTNTSQIIPILEWSDEECAKNALQLIKERTQ